MPFCWPWANSRYCFCAFLMCFECTLNLTKYLDRNYFFLALFLFKDMMFKVRNKKHWCCEDFSNVFKVCNKDSRITLSHSSPTFHFHTSRKLRKPRVFRRFRGYKNGTFNWNGLIQIALGSITQLFPMHPFFTPLKHQKTLRLSNILRG